MEKEELKKKLEEFSNDFKTKLTTNFSTSNLRIKLINLEFEIQQTNMAHTEGVISGGEIVMRCHYNTDGQVVCT